MPTLKSLTALEILDSRGRPTVKATCTLQSSAQASASVPSGASTGAGEALELRDGDRKRFRGMGCLKAVRSINDEVARALVGTSFKDQKQLDDALVALDGTPNKSRLGANAILAVSIAFARACAEEKKVPLYEQFAEILGAKCKTFPRLTINLFSGGKHAGKQVPIQDCLVVPMGDSIQRSLIMMYDIYMTAAELMYEKYGMRLLTADEGGLAPPFESTDAMFEMAVSAIEKAGYLPGKDASLAIDVASSHFYKDGHYYLESAPLQSSKMIDQIEQWVKRYPIVSVEDGLYEDDWEHWPDLCRRIGKNTLVVGDDLLCTDPKRIRKAIESKACNALLLKVNQVGSLSEAAEAYRLARSAGWQITISVRSGETEDNWAADLVVGWNGDQFKNGSITQSERLAKYNRLLEIEATHPLPVVSWPKR